MDQNAFFRAVSRINSVLLLVLLLGGATLFIVEVSRDRDWRARGTVEIAEELGADDSPVIELRLGELQEIRGTDAHYVELTSKATGGKFSGYEPSETRNVVFFVGDELVSHWLYDHQRYVINSFYQLSLDEDCGGKEPAIALYAGVTKSDSSGDGSLSSDDAQTIALLRPDGSGYTEVENDVRQVVDRSVAADGSTLNLLVQAGSSVILKRYSLETFALVSERVVTDIESK